jgi:hypothetical protein
MRGVETPLSEFTALLARYVPASPVFLREKEVVRAVGDFCASSRSWRASIEDFTIAKNDAWIDANRLARRVSNYALAYAVDDIMLTDDKIPLRRMSIEEMDRTTPGWIAHTAGIPTGFMMYNDRRVRLYPAMAADAESVSADIELVLTPAPGITLLPDYIYYFHLDAVMHMAAYRMLSFTGMPWSNPEMAQYHLAAAGMETQKGNNEMAKRAVDAVNDRLRRNFYM